MIGEEAVWKAMHDLGSLLGIPADVRTWRRIRAELVTLRQALHIEGDQTATDAARGLEDVAAHVVRQHEVGVVGDFCESCGEGASCSQPHVDEYLVCSACGQGGTGHADIEHAGDCLLALAWRALGKPGPVGSSPP